MDAFGYDFGSGTTDEKKDEVVNKPEDVVEEVVEEPSDIDNEVVEDEKDDDDDKGKDDDKTSKLSKGDVIEVGDDKYTVDADGNLVDENNKIFKEAKDVDEYLKSFDDVSDSDDSSTIDIIKEALGVELVDDNNNPLQFEDTPEGIAEYVKSAIDSVRKEHYNEAIEALYTKYPIVEEVINYYLANGNSIEGFREERDLSQVVVNDTDVAQQEAIIRLAWQEQGRAGDVDSYIEYLKSVGSLADTAKAELKGIVEIDNKNKEALREKAEAAEKAQYEATLNYWKGVKSIIDNRKIGNYEIPKTIIINKNGSKTSATPEDFFNYLYLVDSKGNSAYQRELMNETPESRINDDLIRAYLKFVGGNYSNLVDMAVAKKEVKILRNKANIKRNNSTKSNNSAKTNSKTPLDFGF